MKINGSIASQLRALSSMEDESQLKQLQNSLDSLSVETCSREVVSALFDLFERFPESDGYGVFWSIIHFLESGVDYEMELLNSVKRCPGEFNLTMVNRLINGGVNEIGGENLLTVLEKVAVDEQTRPDAQARARKLVEYQRVKRQDV